MLNRVVLIGRLTADPELRFTQGGIAVCSFTLAVDRNYKNADGERDADFINIVVWRQLAELCGKYLSKGKLAAVDGSLRIETYEKDGQKRYAAKVQADSVKFLSPPDKTGGDKAAEKAPEDDRPFGPEGQTDDSGLPF